jgi:hypothetical protein
MSDEVEYNNAWATWSEKLITISIILTIAIPTMMVGIEPVYAGGLGTVVAVVVHTGYLWLRGIPPADRLSHGFDDEDVPPISLPSTRGDDR